MADDITIVVRAQDNFSTVLGNFGNIITGISSLVNLAGDAFRSFAGFAMEGINAVGGYERLTLALTSLNAAQLVQAGVAKDMASALEVSGVMAEDLASWLQELAIHSPFTLEGVANAFRLAQAYGFTAEEAKRLTQALIDFSSATGATEYNMSKIALALGQISTVGKLTGQDMLQLTQAGLPVAQILADAFGVTTEKIIEMRTDGLLPAQEVIEAITVWIEDNFAGAADRFSTSWAGMLSTFADLKQMGLRELFTGMLEAIQPFAVELAEFAQGAGMQFARTIGEIAGSFVQNNAVVQIAIDFLRIFNDNATEGTSILSALGQTLQDLGVESNFVQVGTGLENIGDALLLIQFHLDKGMPLLDAFKLGLDSLANSTAGTTLGDIVTRIQEFIQTGQSEGWGQAIKDVFTDVWTSIDLTSAFQNFIDGITNLAENANWTGVGQVIGNILSGAIELALSGLDAIVNRIDWGPFGAALKVAIEEMWAGAFDNTSLSQSLKNAISWLWTGGREEITTEAKQNLSDMVSDWFSDLNNSVNQWISDNFKININASAISLGGDLDSIGQNMIRGIVEGWNSLKDWMTSIFNYSIQDLINDVKGWLGISSPSSVFFNIARDMVLGLIGGWGSLIGTFLSMIMTFVNTALDVFAPILEFFGIDLSTSTGTTGGRTPTTPDDRTGTGGTVNNYYYGPVYFQGAGEPGAYYDCPSPNPFMTAGSGTLATSSGSVGGYSNPR